MKVQVTSEEMYTLEVAGVKFNNMKKVSEWNGMVLYRTSNGQSIIVHGMENRILSHLFGDAKPGDLVAASPWFLEKLPKGVIQQSVKVDEKLASLLTKFIKLAVKHPELAEEMTPHLDYADKILAAHADSCVGTTEPLPES